MGYCWEICSSECLGVMLRSHTFREMELNSDFGFLLCPKLGSFMESWEMPGHPLLGSGACLVSEDGPSLGIVTEDV